MKILFDSCGIVRLCRKSDDSVISTFRGIPGESLLVVVPSELYVEFSYFESGSSYEK